MNPTVLENLRTIIHRESGIHLPPEKEQLLLNRIRKRLHVLGVPDAKRYLEIIDTDKSGEELRRLIDAVSTNVTHFYREGQHFEFLSRLLVDWGRNEAREYRLWSAACSSGEEPYTMAMVAAEAFSGTNSSARILATDISERILHEALAASYSEQQLELVAPMMHSVFFSPIWVVVSSVVGSIFQSCFFGLFISGLTRRNPDIFSERGNGDA